MVCRLIIFILFCGLVDVHLCQPENANEADYKKLGNIRGKLNSFWTSDAELIRIARELVRLDKCEEAIPFYTKAIHSYKSRPWTLYEERKKCYTKMGKWAEAYSDAKALWKMGRFLGWKEELDHRQLVRLCTDLMLSEKLYNEAIICFTEAIKENPSEISYYKQRGDCNKNVANYESAESDYREVLATTPKDKECRISLIRVLFLAGKSEEAVAEMHFLTDVDLGRLGDDFCDREEKFQEAIQCYTEASNQSHLDPEYNLKRGTCYEKMNELDEAINDFKKALQKKQNDEQILEKLILALFKTQRIDEVTKVIKSLSDDKLKFLGERFFNAEKFDYALSIYNEAIEKNFDDAANHNSRGLCHLAMGNLDSALSDFERAVGLAPSDKSCLFNLITALSMIGRTAEALEKLSSLDESKLHSMGNKLLEEGKFMEALECFTEAIRKNPENFYNYERAGVSYLMNGDFEKAKLETERAINLLEPSDTRRRDLEINWCEKLVEARKFPEAKYALKNVEVTYGRYGIPILVSDRIAQIREKMARMEQKI